MHTAEGLGVGGGSLLHYEARLRSLFAAAEWRIVSPLSIGLPAWQYVLLSLFCNRRSPDGEQGRQLWTCYAAKLAQLAMSTEKQSINQKNPKLQAVRACGV